MDVCEPRPRHRGFFLHSSEGAEPDAAEHESAEGLVVRVRFTRRGSRKIGRGIRAVTRSRFESGRQHRAEAGADDSLPAIRSGSVTGSRQRAH
jgi:hypothetical protein